jgi:predicted NBD/HSP70 family sugar kinase
VSKAVKALREERLLEDGEKLLRNEDGRTLSPLRLGGDFVIAGVHVEQRGWRPSEVTTALVGLDSSRVLAQPKTDSVRDDGLDGWQQAAELVHRQVADLKRGLDRARAANGLRPLRLFGVGVEVGTPVHRGEIMPAPSVYPHLTVDLAPKLRKLFAADKDFDQSVPIVVENDVNALAVLAIHEDKYAEPDLVVVSVFDEGVGGGLVMDGRLRRGGNGKAMEIGHLAVGYAPGQNPHAADETLDGGDGPDDTTVPIDFQHPCQCGRYGHVDTLATPSRIQGELRAATFEQASNAAARDPEGTPTPEHAVFARAGSALGRAVAHVCNIVNPSRLIMYLPASLAAPTPGTAATAYLAAANSEITSAFATADESSEYLTIRELPTDPDKVAMLGAKAAAVCVLESFIEHALRLDGCTQGPRHTSTQPSSAA